MEGPPEGTPEGRHIRPQRPRGLHRKGEFELGFLMTHPDQAP